MRPPSFVQSRLQAFLDDARRRPMARSLASIWRPPERLRARATASAKASKSSSIGLVRRGVPWSPSPGRSAGRRWPGSAGRAAKRWWLRTWRGPRSSVACCPLSALRRNDLRCRRARKRGAPPVPGRNLLRHVAAQAVQRGHLRPARCTASPGACGLSRRVCMRSWSSWLRLSLSESARLRRADAASRCRSCPGHACSPARGSRPARRR